jgi:hypothetical protein
MRGISWLAAKTGQLLKKDSAPWSKYNVIRVYIQLTISAGPCNQCRIMWWWK